MLRSLCFALAASAACSLLAQSGTIRPVPHWVEGDVRKVETTTATHVQIDTVRIDISGSSSYFIKVEQARKDRYVLAMRMDENTDLMGGLKMDMTGATGAMMDSVMTQVREVMTSLYTPMKEIQVRYAVSPQGEAIEVLEIPKEQERTKGLLRDGVLAMMSKLAEQAERSLPEIAPDRIDHLVDSIYTSVVQVQVNELNYLLRPYAQAFPTSGSLREPILVHDVNAPLRKDLKELPGTCEIGLDSRTDKEIVCRTIITYDTEALKAAFGQELDGMSLDGLRMTEESVDHIDLRTGWITSTSTLITMRAKTMTVKVDTKSVLKTVR